MLDIVLADVGNRFSFFVFYTELSRSQESLEQCEKLVASIGLGKLQEEILQEGVKRRAPKGLLTIRIVFDPRKKFDKRLWEQLNDRAAASRSEVIDTVRNLITHRIRRSVR